MSGWGCPHESKGTCTRVAGRACDPGMKGCILAGRFRFSNDAKNRPPKAPVPRDVPATPEACPDATPEACPPAEEG